MKGWIVNMLDILARSPQVQAIVREDADRVLEKRQELWTKRQDSIAANAKEIPKHTKIVEATTAKRDKAADVLKAETTALQAAMHAKSQAIWLGSETVRKLDHELSSTADPLLTETRNWIRERQDERLKIPIVREEEKTFNGDGYDYKVRTNRAYLVQYMHALAAALKTVDEWKLRPWDSEEVARHCGELVNSLEQMRARAPQELADVA